LTYRFSHLLKPDDEKERQKQLDDLCNGAFNDGVLLRNLRDHASTRVSLRLFLFGFPKLSLRADYRRSPGERLRVE
jgi:hypothetical protein